MIVLIQYAFNKNAQLVERTLPDGQELEYQYRAKDEARAGLLASIQLKGGVFGLLSETVIDGLNTDTDTSVNYGYRFGLDCFWLYRKSSWSNKTIVDIKVKYEI